MKKRTILIISCIVILCTAIGYDYYIKQTTLQGTITISGAFALYPMMVKWAEEFQKIHPQVKIDISAGGAGKGMTDVLGGLVDIAMISRQIYSEEVNQGAVGVAVVKDAVVPAVNKDNPVLADLLTKGVTKKTFMNIWIFGNVTTWGEVVGRPDVTTKINVYTRSDSCGAADTWALYFGNKQADLKGVGVYGDPGIAQAVQNDPMGIGYNNVNYAYDNSTDLPVTGLVIVPIDLNENGEVDANEKFYDTRTQLLEAITLGTYPSPPARDLYIVAKDEYKGITKEFVKWILTDGQQYVSETGYVKLSQEKLEEELNKLG